MEKKQRNKEPIKCNEEEAYVTATKVQQKSLLIYSVVALVIVLAVGVTLYTQGLVTAAKVNGESISRLSVIGELEEQAGAAVLDSMISDILIEQAATEAGVTVTDDDVTTEIVAIESQVTAQGGALEEVLAQEGLDRESLTKQIRIQKLLEALLSSDIMVTGEEIDAFLAKTGPIPEGQEEAVRVQVAEQLRSQKFSTAAQSYIIGLRTQANIQYLVNYK